MPAGCLHAPKGILIKIIVPVMRSFFKSLKDLEIRVNFLSEHMERL